MSKEEKQKYTQATVWWSPEGRGVTRIVKDKGVKYVVTEDDLTLGNGHTVQYKDHVA